MASTRIALILGSGPRIGSAIIEKFSSNGYKIAVASRSKENSKDSNGVLSLKADLTQPDSIPGLFKAVKAEFNAFPDVVIYNAAALIPPPDEDSVLSLPLDALISSLNIHTVSAYAAAQEAIKGWETLPKEVKKSFIYTGNGLNTFVPPAPKFLTLGVGKSASAFWIGLADQTYESKAYRFFFADERAPDGNIKGQYIDGPAHAEFYHELANHGNVPWHATFVTGKGYVKF